MEPNSPKAIPETLKDALKPVLLEILNGADFNEAIYPGQDKPMSFHLPRLIKAIEEDDIAVISEYRGGRGNWFPYALAVETYFESFDEPRDSVLIVNDDEENLDDLECTIRIISPEIRTRRETTKEAALKAIIEEAPTLKAVITDWSLNGSLGNEGREIAQAAIEAGVPHVAICSASEIQLPEGAEAWDIGGNLAKNLKRFLA